MNKIYGILLAMIFLFGIGAFNIAQGIQGIKKRRKNTIVGIFRIVIGIPTVIIPFVILFYLKKIGQL